MARTCFKKSVKKNEKNGLLRVPFLFRLQCVEMALNNYKNLLQFLHSAMEQEILVVIIFIDKI